MNMVLFLKKHNTFNQFLQKEFTGRKPVTISQELYDYDLNNKGNFNVGYQRMAKVAQHDINPPKKIGE